MWSSAGLSTSILLTRLPPANGMVHHTVASIFVSTKMRDLGPKSSPTRTFWRMVATCIRYQPPTKHLLWNLTTFSLASVKTPCVGTGFLGLAYPLLLHQSSDDTPEFPQIPPICLDDYVTKDSLRLAMYTPLPPVGLLESVLLGLKEGQWLSESTARRLRRKEAEMRAAAAEGRTPLSEYKRRKQKKMALKTSTPQMIPEQSSEKEDSAASGPSTASATKADAGRKSSHHKPTMHLMTIVNSSEGEVRKFSVEDVEKLAAFSSLHRRADSQKNDVAKHRVGN